MKRGFVGLRRSVVLAGMLVLGLAAPALADRAFTARFSTNANGDIAIVGNTLETCQTSVADCANARAGLGTVLNNNNFSMVRVNTDSTALDSSSARLSLPPALGCCSRACTTGRGRTRERAGSPHRIRRRRP